MLHQQGKSARAIAKELGRHHASISREIHRNAKQASYQAEHAQEGYHQRRKVAVAKGKWTPTLAAVIEEKWFA